jgi:Sec-independent protein translocase protein TatA
LSVFGIGLGEILLIVLVTFLVAPKEIPAVLRKLGQFFGMLGKLRDEFMDVGRDVEEIVRDAVPEELQRKPKGVPGRDRPLSSPRKPVPVQRPTAAKPAPTRQPAARPAAARPAAPRPVAPRPAGARDEADRGGGTRGMRGDGI